MSPGAIDREGLVRYVNALLDDCAAGKRDRQGVVARLRAIFNCMSYETLLNALHRGHRLAVRDGRVEWVTGGATKGTDHG